MLIFRLASKIFCHWVSKDNELLELDIFGWGSNPTFVVDVSADTSPSDKYGGLHGWTTFALKTDVKNGTPLVF
ncbi:MAG: hypothetical protein EBU36_06980 [Verrucomicrobia bacterium]|nr:hypothetical protein [Verrucomicrobiota bacterium]